MFVFTYEHVLTSLYDFRRTFHYLPPLLHYIPLHPTVSPLIHTSTLSLDKTKSLPINWKAFVLNYLFKFSSDFCMSVCFPAVYVFLSIALTLLKEIFNCLYSLNNFLLFRSASLNLR